MRGSTATPVPLARVEDFQATIADGVLIYEFTLPLPEPVDPAAASFAAGVYDPEYYVEVLLDQRRSGALRRHAEPGACIFDIREDTEHPIYYGMVYPLVITLSCAVQLMARAAAGAGLAVGCWLGPGLTSAGAANPLTGERAPAAAEAGAGRAPAWGPVAAVGRALLTFQREANRLIAQHMRAIRDGETSLPLLIGLALAFAYGVVHALGPGPRQAGGGLLLPRARGADRARPADGPADRGLPRALGDGRGGARRSRCCARRSAGRRPRSRACAWRATA